MVELASLGDDRAHRALVVAGGVLHELRVPHDRGERVA